MVRALKATIVLLHMAVLFSAGLSFAGGAVLGYLAPLVIEPGERVQQAVEHVSLPGKLIEIRLGTAPSGVSLTTNEAGQLIIDWQTDETLADESLIQLLAKDLRSGEQVESRYLMVRRAVEINERAAEQKTVAQQTEVPVLQKAEAAVLPQIGPFEPQKLFVGMLWQWEFGAGIDDGTIRVEVLSLPPGADFNESESGQYQISWTPTRNQLGSRRLRLRVTDRADTENYQDTVLALSVFGAITTSEGSSPVATLEVDIPRVAEPDVSDTPDESMQGADGPDVEVASDEATIASMELTDRVSASTPAPVQQVVQDPDLPGLKAMPNQVISAGRVVSFRVSASMGSGEVPGLQIDRLPRNASFDINPDGSRTFYWQTSDRDQGEHVFRFSAINPEQLNLRDSQEVLVIVGDPSRNKTLPAPEPWLVNE